MAGRPLPDPEPGQEPSEPGPDDPYPIADTHTRTEAADCVRRALAAKGNGAAPGRRGPPHPLGWEVAGA
ncbi:MAG: hypothetical protein ACRDSL_07985 [Pseudonocardiaceae bacterium]